MMTVSGRKLINSPTNPGHTSSGKNTVSVVMVEAMIGHAIRLEAVAKAVFGGSPSAIFRSANSMVTMAPSTSIPTTRIRLNSTIIFMVMPKKNITVMAARKEPGIAMPTRMLGRIPRAKTITIITRIMAVRTLFSKSPSMLLISPDLSCR